MNCKLFIALLIACYIGVAMSSKAELLFQKKIVTPPVVGKDMEISFIVYNVGEGPAYDISFHDTDFSAPSFEFVNGSAEARWEVLEAGTNVSQTLTVRPSISNVFPLTATVLQFRSAQSEESFSYTAAASYSAMLVESSEEYERRTSMHVKEIIIFVLLCLGSVAFPFSLWGYYKLNYVDGIKKKQQ
ncbi:hypothetical protein SAMD00019534_072830, partial [Acytostelium subglobosum LB1]|uniref:hypothetical protein n=1 Tax=Acytostelium subglobosum LB1 TaxID=1410327 RepID=UPI000644C975